MSTRLGLCSAAWLATAALAAPLPEPAGKARPADRRALPKAASPQREDGALPSFYSANGLAQRGLFDLASQEYRAFLDEHPDHEKAGDARYGLGLCLYRMGRYADAAAALEALVESPPPDREADLLLLLGQSLLAEGRFAPAQAALGKARTAAGDGPRWEAATAGMVEASAQLGQHDAALRLGAEFAARSPDSAWRDRVDWFSAVAAVQAGQDENARRRLTEFVRHHPQSPLHDSARLLLAQCLARAGQPAAESFRNLANESGQPEIKAQALLGSSAALLADGDLPGADAALAQAKSANPESGDVRSLRLLEARIRFAQERFVEALQLFEALADGQDDIARQSAYGAAKCHLRLGRHDVAAEMLGRAGSGENASPEAQYDASVALSRAGRHAEARAAAASFLAAHPEHALAADALILRAVSEYHLADYDAAASSARQVLEHHAAHGRAGDMIYLAADSDFLGGRYEDAAREYHQFLKNQPDSATSNEASLRLAISLTHLKKWDEAREVLEKLVKREGGTDLHVSAVLLLVDVYLQKELWGQAAEKLDALFARELAHARLDEALLKAGIARQRVGDYAAALAHYNRLVVQHPDSPFVDQALFESGQCHAAQADWTAARAAFERVRQRPESSYDAPARRQLAELSVRTGDFAQAAAGFRELRDAAETEAPDFSLMFREGEAQLAAGNFAAAQSLFARCLTSSDAALHAPARARLILVLIRQEKEAEALVEWEKMDAAALGPLDERVRRALQFDVALSLADSGRSEQAATLLKEVATGTSGELALRARLELAGMDMEAERWGAAHENLLAIVTDLGSDAAKGSAEAALAGEATYRLGVCAYRLERWEEASGHLEHWVSGHAGAKVEATARFMLGDALMRQGAASKAAAHLQFASENDDSEVLAAALLRLGECRAALGQWRESEVAFQKFLESFAEREDWFIAAFGAAWAQEHQGRLDDALSGYAKVVARHRGPTAARAQFQIGESHFARKEYDVAARELFKVDILYAYPEWSAAALYEAGRCLDLMGKGTEARQQFELVREKYPDSPWAKLAAERSTENAPKQADAKG